MTDKHQPIRTALRWLKTCIDSPATQWSAAQREAATEDFRAGVRYLQLMDEQVDELRPVAEVLTFPPLDDSPTGADAFMAGPGTAFGHGFGEGFDYHGSFKSMTGTRLADVLTQVRNAPSWAREAFEQEWPTPNSLLNDENARIEATKGAPDVATLRESLLPTDAQLMADIVALSEVSNVRT